MHDMEKVIRIIDELVFEAQKESTWKAENALRCVKKELLKEQDAVVAHWDDDTGHWIEGDRNGIDPHTRITGEMIDTFRCSWCGFYQYWKTPFCPNCGAKMEGR